MAKANEEAREFTQRQTDRAMEAADYGMNWLRDVTEQNLRQSKAMFEGLFATVQKTADTFDQQSSELRERSLSLAAETLSNSFDFAHRVVRVREPQELVQLQSEFISRQAQAFAEQAKELGQTMAQGANDAAKSTLHSAEAFRRRPEAAARAG
jgi:hypothetical protein